ncbi:unnamed protein product [Acanthocheilonema viteae]|uniref:Uncharacterized protein n=1 Tax=Acanthocheilonema viteae TaxID=6277 RepID=A0A498SDX5_ACAVI|nr:unnamed protein product [Acanthocheilonema viteae]
MADDNNYRSADNGQQNDRSIISGNDANATSNSYSSIKNVATNDNDNLNYNVLDTAYIDMNKRIAESDDSSEALEESKKADDTHSLFKRLKTISNATGESSGSSNIFERREKHLIYNCSTALSLLNTLKLKALKNRLRSLKKLIKQRLPDPRSKHPANFKKYKNIADTEYLESSECSNTSTNSEQFKNYGCSSSVDTTEHSANWKHPTNSEHSSNEEDLSNSQHSTGSEHSSEDNPSDSQHSTDSENSNHDPSDSQHSSSSEHSTDSEQSNEDLSNSQHSTGSEHSSEDNPSDSQHSTDSEHSNQKDRSDSQHSSSSEHSDQEDPSDSQHSSSSEHSDQEDPSDSQHSTSSEHSDQEDPSDSQHSSNSEHSNQKDPSDSQHSTDSKHSTDSEHSSSSAYLTSSEYLSNQKNLTNSKCSTNLKHLSDPKNPTDQQQSQSSERPATLEHAANPEYSEHFTSPIVLEFLSAPSETFETSEILQYSESQNFWTPLVEKDLYSEKSKILIGSIDPMLSFALEKLKESSMKMSNDSDDNMETNDICPSKRNANAIGKEPENPQRLFNIITSKELSNLENDEHSTAWKNSLIINDESYMEYFMCSRYSSINLSDHEQAFDANNLLDEGEPQNQPCLHLNNGDNHTD